MLVLMKFGYIVVILIECLVSFVCRYLLSISIVVLLVV